MHTVLVVHKVVGTKADKAVVRLGMLFFYEMYVIGGYEFDIIFACKGYKNGIDLPLTLIDVLVGCRFVGLMSLKFKIIVATKEILKPLHRLLRFGESTVVKIVYTVAALQTEHNLLWQFAAEAGGAADNTLVILLEQFFVDTARVVERIFHKAHTDYTAEVTIALFVLRKQDKVPAAAVDDILSAFRAHSLVALHTMSAASSAVSLTAHYGLEGDVFTTVIFRLLFELLIEVFTVVKQFFYAVHIAVVGKCDGVHTVFATLVYEVRHFGHTVKDRVVRMDVKVSKRHIYRLLYRFNKDYPLPLKRIAKVGFFAKMCKYIPIIIIFWHRILAKPKKSTTFAADLWVEIR